MIKRLIASLICFTFSFSNLQIAGAQDFSINQLPVPGTMVGESASFAPLALKGLIVDPQKPLEFQFIVDTGRGPQDTESVKSQANQLVKYFLAGLTIPEGDLWVNLSPYEKDRIVPTALGQTDLGRDLLAQDYILKQLTATLIYPEKDLGKEFWSRVYKQAQEQFGTTNIPVNTFNKVWILPNQAQVFENGNAAYVTKSTLKVMLDEDYLAKQKHQATQASSVSSQVVRQIILPEIEKEVNTGKNFAPLRQIYQALILAKWYKETIQNGLLDAVYTNKNKVAGVNLNDPAVKEQIYQRYLKAYKKGAFNYIKEDPTPDGQIVPRKYFSGGIPMQIKLKRDGNPTDIHSDGAMVSLKVAIINAAGAARAFVLSVNALPYKDSLEELGFDPNYIILNRLMSAILKKQRDLIIDLILKGADVNEKGPNGETALSLAALMGQGDVVTMLLDDYGADINAKSDYGVTPLMAASYTDQEDVVGILLDKGADVNTKRYSINFLGGRTALMDTSEKGYKKIVEMLLAKGADVNVEDDEGHTALMLAAKKRYQDIVRMLEIAAVKQLPLGSHDTKFMEAVQHGDRDIVKLLLKKGADVNAADKFGKTALMMASEKGYKEIMEMLLAKGADVNAKGKPGKTALMIATENGYEQVVKLLLAKGADVQAQEVLGNTALMMAFEKGYKEIMEMLLAKGADVNKKNYFNETALIMAANNGYKEIMEKLLAKGADVNAKNKDSKTALMAASEKGYKEIVEMLLAKGADVNAKGKPGKMALMIAVENGYKEIVEMLLAKGAAVNAKDKDGKTALMAASEKGYEEIVKLLLAEKRAVNLKDSNGHTALWWANMSSSPELQRQKVIILLKVAGVKDNAMNGGIDLNQINVNRTGKTVNVRFDPAQLDDLMQGGFEGFTPIIINMTAIQSPLPLLGIGPAKEEVLAKVSVFLNLSHQKS